MAAAAGEAGAPGPGRTAGRAERRRGRRGGAAAAGPPDPGGSSGRPPRRAPPGVGAARAGAGPPVPEPWGRREWAEARARRGRGTGAADRRGAGAAEREGGGGGGGGTQARLSWITLGLGHRPTFLVMGLCRVPGDDGTRQRIFLFFFKFLCRVPLVAPGKLLLFFCFFDPIFFVGTCYSKYIPVSKFGTIMSSLTIFP